MTKIPLRIPKIGSKYKITRWEDFINDPELMTVKVLGVYDNQQHGKIVEFMSGSYLFKEHCNLEEWNKRLAIEREEAS